MSSNPVETRLHNDRVRSSWRSLFIAYEETTDRDVTMDGITPNGIPEWHLRCSMCGQSVLRLMSDGTAYHWTPEQLLDRFTAHMRQVHEPLLDYSANPLDERQYTG